VNAEQLQALLPLLVLGIGACLLMLQIAFMRGLRQTTVLSVAILVVAAAATIPAAQVTPLAVTPLLQADRLALLFRALFCLAGAVTVSLSAAYLQKRGDQPEEYFLLLILSCAGACVLAYAVHVASLFLGLELLSIALYALIAYPDKSVLPLEASIKYLVLSGASSATLLFGFALLYSATGSLGFADMHTGLTEYHGGSGVPQVAAMMVVAGLVFKLSLVPFHLWTGDVYDGAPAPVTGFLASVSKAAVFLALLKLLITTDLFRYSILIECLGLMAIASMLVGNLLALLQQDLKRMLAFSSIAHMGYLIIVLMANLTGQNEPLVLEASSYYLIAYTVTTLGAFATLTLLASEGGEREQLELKNIRGLFWHQPLIACLLFVSMLSLAGIPLTAGFIAKFYIFGTAVDGGNWIMLAALVIGSGIGIYYYLRVVYTMTLRDGNTSPEQQLAIGWAGKTVALLLLAGILLLGTVPQPLMSYLRSIL
jgi:NADH-quinone oxidoreductase subunit N